MAYGYTKKSIKDVVKGDTFDRSFLVDSDFPLTGMSVRCQVKEFNDSAAAVLTFTTGDNSIVITGQEIRLRKSADKMNIAVKVYLYDVQFTSPADEVFTLFGGKFIMKQDFA